MSKRWQERWVRVKGAPQGGQGVSFIAKPVDGNGPLVFIKTLSDQRMRQHQARSRFMREVAIYKSLKDLGLPELYDDNTETWEDDNTPLYMATEFIDGPNLRIYIGERRQTAAIDAALECVRELAEVLNRCHQHGVTHRDVKPANIVLANGDIAKPRLVDFGISFNDAADDDLTRVNEDVGNRFLHLPEHARGGRFPASDVTQLAGIFLYTVTGHEPRVLRDESDRPPHQRAETRGVLFDRLDQRQFIRVMSALDRAFGVELLARYATGPELISALETAMRSDQAGGDDLQERLAQVDEIVASQGLSALGERREALQQLMNTISRIGRDFAQARGLWPSQAGNEVHVTADQAWHQNHLATVIPGTQAKTWAVFRIEYRGPNDYVLFVNGEEVWRGESVDQPLTAAAQMAFADQFLASQSDPDSDLTG
jgi:serine/threonine protein kinase